MEHMMTLYTTGTLRDGKVYLLTIEATGPADQIAKGGGDVRPAEIELCVQQFAADTAAEIAERRGSAFVLGRLTPEQVQAVCARIANTGRLVDLFDVVPDGTHVARQTTDTAAIAAVTELVDQAVSQVAGGADLPDGWDRYQMHTPDGSWTSAFCWPTGDAEGAAETYSPGRPAGIAVWPASAPQAAVIGRPERYAAGLADYGALARSPLPRPVIAAALWRAGLHNVRQIASATNADRSTIYEDLRSAGIEPTDRL